MGSSLSTSNHVNEEFTPFLKWNGHKPTSFDLYAPIFHSLVAMVEEGHVFNDAEELKAVSYLDILLAQFAKLGDFIACYLFPRHKDGNQAFVNHIWILLGCSYWNIAKTAFLLLSKWYLQSWVLLRAVRVLTRGSPFFGLGAVRFC
ncbi:hypothetical protein BLNAU_18326 [Blattamonas nauphoetae]|uniref:Uncharacterized protein n=1 Tax=Blattamonas nauphoetae TaxID=2049346 RepID=A0ABQ9X4N8_9EUKA|nr:hypothetical protein BLNAU_18326 [Blattamonas nauphoetae]